MLSNMLLLVQLVIRISGLISVWTVMVSAVVAQSSNGYYRWPTVDGDTVIMSSAGDLWQGSLSEGRAYRLTTHEEEEIEPVLSPDGKSVAFIASYDATREVYVMQLSGGAPKQLSFDGGGVSLAGWTGDGRVAYVSTAVGRPAGRRVRLVHPATLAEEELPLANANAVSFSDDGRTVFFTRFGLANTGDNAKLYRGGGMSQLWRFDLNGETEARRLAPGFGAPIRRPMQHDGRVYFISDKSGESNLWSMDAAGDDIVQHSTYEDWGVRSPRLYNGRISYQLGADIYAYDIAGDQSRKIDIALVGDHDGQRTRWLNEPLEYLTSARFAPQGDRVALTARGKIALMSPEPLRRVEFAIPENARAREGTIGADGDWVYAVIDQGERGEIWRFPLDGRGEAQQLTEDASAHRWGFDLSPYGKYMLHTDKQARLWLYDIEAGTNRLLDVVEGPSTDAFSDVSWSPDNQYAAYTRSNGRGIDQIVLVELRTRRREIVTTGKYDSFSPAFSADGNWLYFVSNRNFQVSTPAPWGDRNMGAQFDRRGKIFALALNLQVRFPFKAKDELSPRKPDTGDGDDEENETAIVWEGLKERLYETPVPAGNLSNLKAKDGLLYFLDRTGQEAALKSLKIDALNPEVKIFSGNVRSYALSRDGEKIFYALSGQGNQSAMFIVDAGPEAPGDTNNGKLRTADWKIPLDPESEWRQLFLDAWRLHRDFAFDPNLRGLDWQAVREQYEPLVDRVSHRSELNDLFGQMISELGILHSQVRATDLPVDEENGAAASLGARFESAGGGLRVIYIYRSESDLPGEQPPLAKPDVDIRIGDIILAVNGEAVATKADLYRLLLHRAGQQVALDVRRGKGAARKVIVEPVPANRDRQLLYTDWIEGKRNVVAEVGGGDIGYLHLRAMGRGDIASFARDFYEHHDKAGLIIDVRGNRGGNIDSWIIQTLLRRVWAFWHFDGRPVPYGNMQQTFRGHLTVLVNEGTYSDGETFAAGVKVLNLGELIGTRTAGAGIWLGDRNRLSDNGIARIAESPQFGLDGRWLIEGYGVDPDIVVENTPNAAYRGEDQQLQAAIDYLKQKIASEPVPPLIGSPIPPVGEHGRDPGGR